jgi:hypothetical protein
MFLGHVTFGDGDETRQPRFRGQQVIERLVVVSFSDVVTNRENLPFGIEQEFEIRVIDKSLALGAVCAILFRSSTGRRLVRERG